MAWIEFPAECGPGGRLHQNSIQSGGQARPSNTNLHKSFENGISDVVKEKLRNTVDVLVHYMVSSSSLSPIWHASLVNVRHHHRPTPSTSSMLQDESRRRGLSRSRNCKDSALTRQRVIYWPARPPIGLWGRWRGRWGRLVAIEFTKTFAQHLVVDQVVLLHVPFSLCSRFMANQ